MIPVIYFLGTNSNAGFFILMFFVLGALLIISNNNLFINDSQDFGLFFSSYLTWLNQSYLNFQDIFVNIIGLDWIPR